MHPVLVVCTWVLGAAALLLTLFAALRPSPRADFAGGILFVFFLFLAMVSGAGEKTVLLFSLVFLIASGAGRIRSHEL